MISRHSISSIVCELTAKVTCDSVAGEVECGRCSNVWEFSVLVIWKSLNSLRLWIVV